jgi:competence protein ComEC
LHVPPVEILKVAHHGSDDPGLPRLLEQIHPRVAVISVGTHNDYGHPKATTIAALAALPGLAVYRTDRDGRVVVESDGKAMTVRTER